MIKKISILLFLGFIPTLIYSQLIRTEYYNLEWMKARETSYDFKREIYKVDSGFQIKDFNRKGKIQMIGLYSSIDSLIENGHFKFFSKKGVIEAEGDYTNGTMSGIWRHYDKKGKLRFELNFDFNDIKCDLPSDKKEEQSTENQDYIIVERMPLFNGNDFQSFQKFITMNIVYPPMAARHYNSGKVIITFTVNSDGYVCNVITKGDAHKDLKTEAKRVVLTSPQWQPGKQKGEPVAVQFSFPIRFFFE